MDTLEYNRQALDWRELEEGSLSTQKIDNAF